MSQDFKDDIVTDLKVIAMLPPCGRLNIKNNLLNLEGTGFWVPAKRWLFMQNRTVIVHHIRHLFVKVGETLDQEPEGSFFVLQVRELMEGVSRGMANLKATYSDDAQTSAFIELLLDRWRHILSPASS